MLRITTLWFSESISPLSETDDVRSTHCFSQYTMREVLHDVIHIARYKMKPTNPMHLFDAIRITFNSRSCSVFIVRIEILTIVLFKMCFALVNIIQNIYFQRFSINIYVSKSIINVIVMINKIMKSNCCSQWIASNYYANVYSGVKSAK